MVQVAHKRVCGCKRPGQSENLACPFQPVQKTVAIMIRILNIVSCFRLKLTHFNFSCCFSFSDSDDAIAYSLACGLGRESHTFLHSLDLFLLQYGNSITKVKTIERPQTRTCSSIFH